MFSLKATLPRTVPTLSTRVSRARFSQSPLVRTARAPQQRGLVGVANVLAAPASSTPVSTLLTQEFALTDRVALVTGGNRGIGLEMAMALSEAGARAVYCLDLQSAPGDDWSKVRDHLGRMGGKGRMEYIQGDVCDQKGMWKVADAIASKEGRLDVCVAAAGVLGSDPSSLEFPDDQFQSIIDVNLKGVLFTAQAAGRQMRQLKSGGSIVLIASICGHVALEPNLRSAAYHSSKSAVLQLGRSMACELGLEGIRVNTISPGYIKTTMTSFLDDPAELQRAESGNPLGRVGRTADLRGAVTFLASDASSFCTGSDILVSGGHTAW